MKYCNSCGAQLSDDAMFCMSCGAKQEAVVQPQMQQAIEPQSQFAQLQMQPQQTQSQFVQPQMMQPTMQQYDPTMNGMQPEKKKGMPVWAILLIVFGSVFAVFGVIIAAVLGPSFSKYSQKSARATDVQRASMICTALATSLSNESYYDDYVYYNGDGYRELELDENASCFGSGQFTNEFMTIIGDKDNLKVKSKSVTRNGQKYKLRDRYTVYISPYYGDIYIYARSEDGYEYFELYPNVCAEFQ